MSNNNSHPRVGIGVIIKNQDGKFLLLRRAGSHGSGSWAFIGGHLEYGESPFTCAKREVLEEAGIRIKNLRLGPYTNDIFEREFKHYVTLFVLADYAGGKLQIKEPAKCTALEWFSWNKFPSPLFIPVSNLRRSGFKP